MMAISMKDSSLRRSGNQTLPGPPPQADSAPVNEVWPELAPLLQTKYCGKPLFPPGGVIPPRPLTSKARSRGDSHTPNGT